MNYLKIVQVVQKLVHETLTHPLFPTGESDVYFVADEAIKDTNYPQVLLGNKDLLFMTLPQQDIREVHKRWFQLKDNGLEVFLNNGKTCLLSFANTKVS